MAKDQKSISFNPSDFEKISKWADTINKELGADLSLRQFAMMGMKFYMDRRHWQPAPKYAFEKAGDE